MARVGALTSATKVVLDKALMVEGTLVGLAMEETREPTWGMMSALGRMEQRVAAVFLACVETYKSRHRDNMLSC